MPLLPDMRKHSTMICEIPNDFFLLDGKNTQLSKVVNTWTFDRLTPNGNEGVGVKLDYLECTYGTRYYVIDKVNGDINAIHDECLELTEFKGHFSPLDLENLEAKVCRLADGKDEEDITEHQNAQQLRLTNPRTLNMEIYEGMGFDKNNCSPIPPVSQAKHGWFKDYRWKNFMNLPCSLAEKHQLFLAHNMTTTEGHPNSMFVYKGDVVKERESVTPAEMDPMIVNAIPHHFDGETLFYKTDNV